jgi:hypothetical protein
MIALPEHTRHEGLQGGSQETPLHLVDAPAIETLAFIIDDR